MSLPDSARARVVIERITPNVDQGRFPVKRIVGESVTVEADIFVDGHDVVCARLLHRPPSSTEWQSTTMVALGNDRFAAEFEVTELGLYEYTIAAWADRVETWRRGLLAKHAADQDVSIDLLYGAQLVRATAARAVAARASEHDVQRLEDWANALEDTALSPAERVARAQADGLLEVTQHFADPQQLLRHEPPLPVSVDRPRARYSTWYEFFPRSSAAALGTHGTFADCAARLREIAAMGFDVVYFPPIHPIGATNRKGPNGATRAAPGEPGSPWAIGGDAGGHKAIHPSLGTLEGFRRLLARASALGLEVALDLAFQCSPDHPYVREHPEWFLRRPDGSVQYAENPPKKYEDIYPFDFETPAWRELWAELASVVDFWMDVGVRIFRVDNPHTKPFAFWEWLIARARKRSPEVIFLAEAFTRPKVMYRLAKLGFTQSYTYFAWRNTSAEIAAYFTELHSPPVSEFFRANLWPNTPDILTETLQHGGRPAFMARLVLAATLGASYGIYGPPFERMEHEPRSPGSEEYRDSEKYQLRGWGPDHPGTLVEFITLVNRIRRENAALQSDHGLTFHRLDNEMLMAFSKTTRDQTNTLLTVVNLDSRFPQSGWVDLDLQALGVSADAPFEVRDLLTEVRYNWRGPRNFVRLEPERPAHILQVQR